LDRIQIAEDRESMRKALKALLIMHPQWEVCGEAEDGLDAVTLRPDLIVMDFRMHRLKGLMAANEIFRLRCLPCGLSCTRSTKRMRSKHGQTGWNSKCREKKKVRRPW